MMLREHSNVATLPAGETVHCLLLKPMLSFEQRTTEVRLAVRSRQGVTPHHAAGYAQLGCMQPLLAASDN